MAADWDLRDKIMAGMAGLGTLAAVSVVGVLWTMSNSVSAMSEKQTATNDRLSSLEATVKQGSADGANNLASITQLVSRVVERQNTTDTILVGLIKDVERLKERAKMDSSP